MTQESKQKQFHVHKSYKTCKSTLLCIGNSQENIDLSRIYSAVLWLSKYFPWETSGSNQC